MKQYRRLTGSLVLVLAVYGALSLLFSMASIVTNYEVFAQFKEDSRKQYKRMWLQFRDYLFVGIVLCMGGGRVLKLCVNLGGWGGGGGGV
jgi:hypothetical protein